MYSPPINAHSTDDVEKLRDQLDLYIHEKSELQQTLEIAQKDLEMFIGRDAGTRAEGVCMCVYSFNSLAGLSKFACTQYDGCE